MDVQREIAQGVQQTVWTWKREQKTGRYEALLQEKKQASDRQQETWHRRMKT